MAAADVVEELLNGYRSEGAGPFDAAAGRTLWQQQHLQAKLGQQVSCASCHSPDLTQTGKHIKTGKLIKPMALSVNPERYQDDRKIEKWFLRNCKWTFGRECSLQEKADILSWLSSQ